MKNLGQKIQFKQLNKNKNNSITYNNNQNQQ